MFELEDPNAADDPFTIWFNNLEAALQQFQEDYLIHDTNFDPDHKLTIDLTEEGAGFNGINAILGGRYTNDKPDVNDEIRSAAVSAVTSTTIAPPDRESSLANLTAFITRQSQLENRKKGAPVPIKKDENGYDFKLIYRDTRPSPLYLDTAKLNLPLNAKIHTLGKTRVRRQAVLDVPIPVLRPFYSGKEKHFLCNWKDC